MSANTIPDDVMEAARAVTTELFDGTEACRCRHCVSASVDIIARAILAERRCATDAECMRCYAIAEAEYKSHIGPFCSQPASVAAWSIAEAIVIYPSAASSRAEQTGVEVDPPASAPVPNLTHEEAQ